MCRISIGPCRSGRIFPWGSPTCRRWSARRAIFRRNQALRGRFRLLQGDSDMKRMLCAAHGRAGIRASMIPALLCAMTLGGSALAAPAGNAPAENTGLEEIIVTAEKRESTVQATPIAITALTANDLPQENITTLEDLLGKVPDISPPTPVPTRPHPSTPTPPP